MGAYLYFGRDLPSVEALRTTTSPGDQGQLRGRYVCAEFYLERRTLVRRRDAAPRTCATPSSPPRTRTSTSTRAWTSRASSARRLKSLIPGGRKSRRLHHHPAGGEEPAPLARSASLARKIREWILTPRMEQALTKDQILNLYINQIDFGHGRYGVEEAALYYFGKHAKDLSIGEAAVLAGTPQRPTASTRSPTWPAPRRARSYVLGQMAEAGLPPVASRRRRSWTSPSCARRRGRRAPVGGYYAEEIRRTLIARYGERAVLTGGLRVEIAMVPKLQAAGGGGGAQRAGGGRPAPGLPGALWATLEVERFEQLKGAHRPAHRGGRPAAEGAESWRTSPRSRGPEPEPADEDEGAEERPETEPEGEARALPRGGAGALRAAAPAQGGPAPRAASSPRWTTRPRGARVDLVGPHRADLLRLRDVGAPGGEGKWTRRRRSISDVLKPGQLVRVRVLKACPRRQPLEATLDQVPVVQGGAGRSSTRPTATWWRWWAATTSSARAFNRATQAQPAAGLVLQALHLRRRARQRAASPRLEHGERRARGRARPVHRQAVEAAELREGRVRGPMTLRQALTKSKNTVSVRLIEAHHPGRRPSTSRAARASTRRCRTTSPWRSAPAR